MEPRAPGIQIREVEVAPPAFLRLGVAGFVGQAERGPLHSPQAVANWGQYTDLFGGFLGHSYLSYAVYGFFLNGGKRCFVVRTEHVRAEGAGAELLAGLAAFERVAEIGTVAIPDLVIPDLLASTPAERIPEAGIIFADVPSPGGDLASLKKGQGELLRHCQVMGERFAILDPPPAAEIGRGPRRIEDWAVPLGSAPESKNGALYFPWIRQRAADFGGRDLLIPPSGHLAGIYARSEDARGIGKAPANELLNGVVELAACVDDADQAMVNTLGVNCLRALPGRGLRVWGARTPSRDPEWRYVNVRRVALAIVKQILVRLRWTVFEPNDRRLWDAVKATLTLFLTSLFRSGALAGATPEEAFFVDCGAATNPPAVVDQGWMVARVGFAPARPAEFVVVTIRRTADALAVSEDA
jgi:uncharacterized protein